MGNKVFEFICKNETEPVIRNNNYENLKIKSNYQFELKRESCSKVY